MSVLMISKLRNRKMVCLLTAVCLMASCVPARKFEDQKSLTEKYKLEKENCDTDLSSANGKIRDLEDENYRLQRANTYLADDTLNSGTRYRKIERLNQELQDTYDKLLAQNNTLASNASREKEELSLALAKKEAELNKKETALAELDAGLKAKQKDIDELSKILGDREVRMKELESLIHKRDSAVSALKTSIMAALKGFNASELTVEERNGQVYVSMSEKLLFQTGSFSVDPKGQDALAKIAEVLNKQNNIQIQVEGHTDNVAYASSTSGPINDNWDLSVMRATSVVKILVDKNKMDPKRITASGHGEYMPIADNKTADGKARNRRTEIILAPDLSSLYKLLDAR